MTPLCGLATVLFLITNAHFSYTMRFENQQWFIQPNNNIKVNENQKQK
jgi:hypothetical protein